MAGYSVSESIGHFRRGRGGSSIKLIGPFKEVESNHLSIQLTLACWELMSIFERQG